MRDVRDSPWGLGEPPRRPAAPGYRVGPQEDPGTALDRAMAGVPHLHAHRADIEARRGRTEAGMEHLLRTLPPLLFTLP